MSPLYDPNPLGMFNSSQEKKLLRQVQYLQKRVKDLQDQRKIKTNTDSKVLKHKIERHTIRVRTNAINEPQQKEKWKKIQREAEKHEPSILQERSQVVSLFGNPVLIANEEDSGAPQCNIAV